MPGADLGFCRKGRGSAGQVWLQVFEKRIVNQTIGYSRFLRGMVLSLKWGVQLTKEYADKTYHVNTGTMARNPHIVWWLEGGLNLLNLSATIW